MATAAPAWRAAARSKALLLAAAIALAALALPAAHAYTDPNNYNRLVAFRDAMRTRSPNWAAALSTWTCPTPAANSVPPGTCDPCGQLSDGNWYHMHCRGNSRGWGESGDGTKNGLTTNMHITSSQVDGPVPKELCIIPTLREHDFGGQLNKGHLTGPIPRFLGRCYLDLEELDLSNNRLTGTLPPYLASIPKLSEIKFENNAIIGTIPPEIGTIKRLRRFQAEFNNMRGPIPQTFKNAAPYLTQLHLARNDFEGDLSMLAQGTLTTVTMHDNPKLCGMVPASVRFAKGYNPGNTGLGRPCPGSRAAPAPPSASDSTNGTAARDGANAAAPPAQPSAPANGGRASGAQAAPDRSNSASPRSSGDASGDASGSASPPASNSRNSNRGGSAGSSRAADTGGSSTEGQDGEAGAAAAVPPSPDGDAAGSTAGK